MKHLTAEPLTDKELAETRRTAEQFRDTTVLRLIATVDAARGTIAAVRAEALTEGCQDVLHKPAEVVSKEMAIDAGDPTMAGTLLRRKVPEPCGACVVCRFLALLDAHDKEGE